MLDVSFIKRNILLECSISAGRKWHDGNVSLTGPTWVWVCLKKRDLHHPQCIKHLNHVKLLSLQLHANCNNLKWIVSVHVRLWLCVCVSVCARVCVCVSCRDHSASAASLISRHHGTCLNSKRGLERTSCPPGESLRLPSAHSGHSSYHTLFSYTMSNPPVGLKTRRRRCWSAQDVCGVRIYVCMFVFVHAWRVIEGERCRLDSETFWAVCGSHWMCCMISSSRKRQNCATTVS